jgi:hypothetical protein
MLSIIDYEKQDAKIIFPRRWKKNFLETHCHFVVDTTSLPERAHRDDSNATKKGRTMTPKEKVRAIRATTQKANQIKYHRVSISCLYLSN